MLTITMDKIWMFFSSVILLSVIQTQQVLATGCNIVSVTSPSASTLNVTWSSYPGASVYLLELRVVNSTSIAPVAITQSAPRTQRLIQGLRPGSVYQVTLKVFVFLNVVCTDVKTTITVPDTSQITFSKALSSTSISLEWSSVIGADNYILFVVELFSSPAKSYIQTFTTLGGQVNGLSSSTSYNCYVYSSNSAGRGASSKTKTITTLVQPPTGVTLVSMGKSTAQIKWNRVSNVLLYQVTVRDNGNLSKALVIRNTSTTYMDIVNLEPCSNYTVGVSSVNGFLLPGEASNVIYTTSNIDPVTTVSVDYSCSSGMATVTWNLVFEANMYRAVAVDGTGASLNCTSSSTSCQIPMLKCGEKYQVHVTAISDNCESTSNATSLFETVPCAPANPTTSHDCNSNVMVFSWDPTNNTFYYEAMAVDNTGRTFECRTADNTCAFTDTYCGQFYTFTVYAVSYCNSEVSQPEFVSTSPCLPENVMTGAECHSDLLITTWDSAAGALSYTVEAQGNTGETYKCTTSSNSCAVSGVPCGEHLSVWITASNDDCSTDKVLGDTAQTVPCDPIHVSASVDCSQDSARVNWTTSVGVIFYSAIAEDGNGNLHSCNSMDNNCLIKGLRCGQNYTASVIGTNLECNSSASNEVTFMTGLCAPINVTVSPACEGSTVSWTHVTGAEMYVATATAADGHNHTCSSNYSSSCNFTGLHCGETYTVTVVTVDRGCWSKPSSAVKLRTALCPPTNLTGQVSCNTNALTLKWDPTPVSGVTYTLQTDLGSQFSPSVYTTSNTTHTLTNRLCGQRYAVRIAAQDGNCRGSYSSPIEIKTAPCQPTNLTAHVDCGTNKGNFSWFESSGVGFYTVEVTGEHGHVASCSSNDTSCAVGLDCGHSYSATLVASTESCNSSKHADIHFDSAPCLIEDVSAELQCKTNVMNVNWTGTPGSDNYTAWAISTDGHRASCNSTSNSCSIHDLQCGKVYEVAVISSSIHCKIIAGSDYNVQSAPCKPENTTVEQSCSSNTMTVKWSQGSATQNNTVTATSASGVNSTWVSTKSSYSFLDLSCGQLYTFTVMGYTNVCMSEMSTPVEKPTAPCPPTSVSAELNCSTRTALVSWSSAAAATAYSVQATSMSGLNSSCSEMGTSCSLNNLVCGQEYSVVVVAMNTGCPGPASGPAMLATEPCQASSIKAVLDCEAHSATISWQPCAGAYAYVTELTASSGHTASCTTNHTNCELSSLQCGEEYNVTVMALGYTCNNTAQMAGHLTTEPCAPMNLSVHYNVSTAQVMWEVTKGANSYSVQAVTAQGWMVTCNTTNTSCSLNGLQCGQIYNVTVMARNRACNSVISKTHQLMTEPCPPTNVKASLECDHSMSKVSWQKSDLAVGYVAYFENQNGHHASCGGTETDTQCVVQGLMCGTVYNVWVKALGRQFNSSDSTVVSLTSAPCLPREVEVEVDCNSDGAAVSWNATYGAANFSLTAIVSGSLRTLCATQQNRCNVTGLSCGETYNLSLTASNTQCSLTALMHANLTTRPCPPQRVAVDLQCSSHTAVLSWEESSDVELYVARAINSSGGEVKTCNSTGSTCQFASLDCGETYNFTVTAHRQSCRSQASSTVFIQTGPCQPDGLSVTFQCNNQSAQLSWTPRDNAVDYYGFAQAGNGDMLYCHSRHPMCTIQRLDCGTVYNFSVQASDGKCNSSFSDPVQRGAAPCPPDTVKVKPMAMQKAIQVLRFSWTAATCRGTEYILKLTGSLLGDSQALFELSSYLTSTTYFEIPLLCGSTYSATVESRKAESTSNPSVPLNHTTAPCPPPGVVYSGNSSFATVSWNASVFATTFRVYDNNVKPRAQLCNTTELSCSLTNITSTNIVITAGNTAGESEATSVFIG